jgi:hypothetical protein
VPTLADAQRQVWVRGLIGWLLIVLAVIFLLLVVVKSIYVAPSGPSSPSFLDWEAPLRRLLQPILEPILRSSAVLSWLWQMIPIWTPANPWNYLYALWGALVVSLIGGRLVWSARTRRAEIMDYYREMQREAWREQARAARGGAPASRGPTAVIGQAIWQWHEYAAPPEPWSQTIRGILSLGLIVAFVSGLILLCAEYWFFQAYWPSSRN